jgi:hypothetical protein
MKISGTLNLVDSKYQCFFIQTPIDDLGGLQCIDSTHQSPFYGFVISDSTRIYPDSTYIQGSVFGRGELPNNQYALMDISQSAAYNDGTAHDDPTSDWVNNVDPPIYFHDTVYTGYLDTDGTYKGGSLVYRSYDPIWLTYSLWYVQDASNNQLIGNRYREPVRRNVGDYYISMVVPRETGHYEIRWKYKKDNHSYVREIVEGFLCTSLGIDTDRS